MRGCLARRSLWPPSRRDARVPVALMAAAVWLDFIANAGGARANHHDTMARPAHRPARTSVAPLQPHVYKAAAANASFPYDCRPSASATAALFKPLTAPDTQAPAFPPWMAAACPEVVTHFRTFPYFSQTHGDVPVITSVQAAYMVCTIKIASAIASHAGTTVMLYAGSFIGALRHGGPIPWDDDVDLAMPYQAYAAYMKQCAAMTHAFHPDLTVHCVSNPLYGGYIKLYVRDRCGGGTESACDPSTLISQNASSYPWRWPFADIFLSRTTQTSWEESAISGDLSGRGRSFPVESVLQAQLYYFGGLALPGPAPEYASLEYKWRACVTGGYNHRDERPVRLDRAKMRINCCAAARHVPFVVGEEVVGAGDGGGVRALLPSLLQGAVAAAGGSGLGEQQRSV